jgi:hypothetical protein
MNIYNTLVPSGLQALSKYKNFIIFEITKNKIKSGEIKYKKYPKNASQNVLKSFPPARPGEKTWLQRAEDFTSLEHAANFVNENNKLGFVLEPHMNLVILDFDNCLNEKKEIKEPIIKKLVQEFIKCDAFVGISCSKRGLHIWGRAGYFELSTNRFYLNLNDAGDLFLTDKQLPSSSKFSVEIYNDNRGIALEEESFVDIGSAEADITSFLQKLLTKHKETPSMENVSYFQNEFSPEKIAEKISSKMMLDPKFKAHIEGDTSFFEKNLGMKKSDGALDPSAIDFSFFSYLAKMFKGNKNAILEACRYSNWRITRNWNARQRYLESSIDKVINQYKKDAVLTLKKETFEDRMEFYEQFYYVQSLKKFVWKNDFKNLETSLLDRDNFELYAKPVGASYKEFQNTACVEKIHKLGFDPNKNSLELFEDSRGNKIFNTFDKRLLKDGVAGDPQKFIDWIAYLVPLESDREILISYFATLVQNPGIKLNWSVVLQSKEGAGKSTLIKILRYALGQDYVIGISVNDLKDKFNGWQADKLLVFIEETSGLGSPSQLYEQLKDLITQEYITINEKFLGRYTQKYYVNFILLTNYKDCLKANKDSRRFAFFFCDSGRRPTEESNDFHTWLEENGGYDICTHFLKNFKIPSYLDQTNKISSKDAPRTSFFEEAISSTYSEVQSVILEAVENGAVGFRNGWIASHKLINYFEEFHPKIRLPIHKIKKILDSMGYIPHPQLSNDGKTGAEIDGTRPRLYVFKENIELLSLANKNIPTRYQADQN